jgi:hypothetical protein
VLLIGISPQEKCRESSPLYSYPFTGCLLATIDEGMEKIGPVPSGCGEDRAIRRSRPRLWTRHSLRTRPRLARFSHATPSAQVVGTGLSHYYTWDVGLLRPRGQADGQFRMCTRRVGDAEIQTRRQPQFARMPRAAWVTVSILKLVQRALRSLTIVSVCACLLESPWRLR